MVNQMQTTDGLRSAAQQLGDDLPIHLVTLHGLGASRIEALCNLADTIRSNPGAASEIARCRVLATMFFQPSTRTRLNFEAAMARLGGSSTGFASADVTRSGDFYQETLEDAVAFTSRIVDVVALRHPRSGAARDASMHSAVPLISAGDGYNEHPTQGLGDIYTMRRLLGGLSGRSIGLLGDSKVRSLKSIVAGLAQLKVGEIVFLLPPGFELDTASEAALSATGTRFRFVKDVRELLSQCDLIETIGTRHPDHTLPKDSPLPGATPDAFRITRELLEDLKSPPPILHPGPRTDEIHTAVDGHDAARYFDQAENGMWMRAALLACALCRLP